jgi:O-antigen ligase
MGIVLKTSKQNQSISLNHLKESFFIIPFALLISFSLMDMIMGTYMTINRFLYASVLVLFFVTIIKNRPIIRIPSLFLWYTLFAFIAFFSFIYAYDVTLTYLEFRNILMAMAVFLAVYNYCSSKKRVLYLIAIYLIIAILSYACMLKEVGLALYKLSKFGDEAKSYNTIALEFILGAILSFFAGYLTTHKIKFYLLSVLFTFIVFSTGSVKGAIGIVFFFSFLLIYKIVSIRIKIRLRFSPTKLVGTLCFFAVLISSAYLIISKDLISRPLKRITNTVIYLVVKNPKIAQNVATSVQGQRSELVKRGIQFWEESPILGSGINNYRYLHQKKFGYSIYSHSTPIELLVGTGIVGTLFYYIFFLLFFYRFIRYYRKTKSFLYIAFIAALLSLMLISFGQRMYADFYQFFFLALVLSLAKIEFFRLNPLSTTRDTIAIHSSTPIVS